MFVGLKVMLQIAVETIHQYVYAHSHVFTKKFLFVTKHRVSEFPNFVQKLLWLVKRIFANKSHLLGRNGQNVFEHKFNVFLRIEKAKNILQSFWTKNRNSGYVLVCSAIIFCAQWSEVLLTVQVKRGHVNSLNDQECQNSTCST